MGQAGRTTFTRIRLKGGTGSYILAAVLTTTQRDALTAAEGMIIFNSTTDQLEEYDGATWQAVGQVIMTTHIADLDAHTKNAHEVLRTGEYWASRMATDKTLSANTLYACPIVVPRAITIDRLAIDIHGSGAGGTKARLGIYNDGTNMYPGTLVKDYGEVAVSSTGVVAASADQSLAKGVYWFALVTDGTPTIKIGSIYDRGIYPLGVSATDFEALQVGWSVAFSYAALPATFTAGGSLISDEVKPIPRIKSLD